MARRNRHQPGAAILPSFPRGAPHFHGAGMKDQRNSETTQGGCVRPRRGDGALQTSGLDSFELAVLEVTRLMLAYARGHRPRYAPDLSQVARNLFGSDAGDMVLAGVTAMVQTVTLSRSEPLRHANPFCVGCSSQLLLDEGRMMRVVHHLRRGRTGQATLQAVMLCEARPVAALLAAAAELAALGPCPQAE